MGLLEPIRKWIDGETDDPFEVPGLQPRPRRTSEEFLVMLAREIGAVMEYEMFTPPGGPTYIPREYIVFLSSDDDKEWRGDKRRGLESGLFNALQLRARELCKHTHLSVQSFTIELRVDGTLAKGQFRVRAIWDTETNKTLVSMRPSKTSLDMSSGGIAVAEEITEVHSRPCIVLYSLEILRDGVRQTIVPVTKLELTIGRGSRLVPVDLPLTGDPEVSRLHAILVRETGCVYRLIAKGQNPVFVNGRELPLGESVQIRANDEIRICSFTLRIQ